MKRLNIVTVVLAVALASCSSPAPRSQEATSESTQAPVRAKGTGEVVAIQQQYGAVTLRHEAIPEYGMGAMTMEFTTANASQLGNLKVGDRVTFSLKGPTDIETIEVAP